MKSALYSLVLEIRLECGHLCLKTGDFLRTARFADGLSMESSGRTLFMTASTLCLNSMADTRSESIYSHQWGYGHGMWYLLIVLRGYSLNLLGMHLSQLLIGLHGN